MNKKIFMAGVVLMSIAIGLFIVGCDDGAQEDKTGRTLVCFGDSLTAGYGALSPGVEDKTQSYPAFLQKKVALPVINAGRSGDTTTDAVSRIQEVISHDPRIVIIEFGANDLFDLFEPSQSTLPLEFRFLSMLGKTQENLQSIISSLDNGNRKLYLAKFYTEAVARSLMAAHEITNPTTQTNLIASYDTLFNELATDNDVTLIEDIWEGVWGDENSMSDAVHPNAQGYEKMADNYFTILKPYLQENNLLN